MNAQPSEPADPTSDHVTVSAADMQRLTEICHRAARGDLEARLTGLDPASDFGRMGRSVNALLDMADAFVREASAAMSECSHGRFHRPILERGLQGAFVHGARVINEAGTTLREYHHQIGFVGRLAEENSHKTQTVAAACEELNATTAEISRRVGDVSHKTEQTVGQVGQVNTALQQLGLAAGKIDRIVHLINQVAGQTNLLALNATIEAARAGEHGRSFAVVATEVKELSRNTRTATADISREVAAVQEQVRMVTSLIAEVTTSIQAIATGANSINHSVQEQVAASGEISRSIQEVSVNTGLVSQRIQGTRQAGTGSP